MQLYPKLILDALAKVRYPGNGKDLVANEMIEDDIRIDGNKVSFSIIFDKPTDHFIRSVVKAAETAILTFVSPEVNIKGNIAVKARQTARPNPENPLPDVKNIIAVGRCRFFLESTKYRKVRLDKVLFIYRVKKTLTTAKSMLLTSIYQFLWNLTIIGGIIKHYSYLLVPYIIAENPTISGKDAIELSRKMMNGRKLEAFKLELSLLPWYLLGVQ